MLVEVVDDYETLSDRAAAALIEQIRKKPDSTIGFATGGTPKGLYERLIEAHEKRGLDFSKLTTFNLDEVLLLASGERKASAIKKTLEGPLTAMVPASMVQMHRVARGIVDEEAASALDYEHHHGIAEPKEQ